MPGQQSSVSRVAQVPVGDPSPEPPEPDFSEPEPSIEDSPVDDAPYQGERDAAPERDLVAIKQTGVAWCTEQEFERLCRAADEIADLRGTIKQDDARLVAAAERAGISYVGCDTADALADEIAALREDDEIGQAAVANYELQLKDLRTKNERLKAERAQWPQDPAVVLKSYNECCEENERLGALYITEGGEMSADTLGAPTEDKDGTIERCREEIARLKEEIANNDLTWLDHTTSIKNKAADRMNELIDQLAEAVAALEAHAPNDPIVLAKLKGAKK
jgi:FtsZ-binding cell division protein ZapB